MKKKENWLRKVPHSFEVHSNESACRNSGRLGLEQVLITSTNKMKVVLLIFLFNIPFILPLNLSYIEVIAIGV